MGRPDGSYAPCAYRLWLVVHVLRPHVPRAAIMPCNKKEYPMTSQTSFASPTRADVDRLIAQARQMRSDYIAQSFNSGFTRLRSLFLLKRVSRAATA